MHTGSIKQAITESDIFVFNGDTFDFRWSVFESVEATTIAAISWLRELVSSAPHCHFYFVLGNHDNVKVFMDALIHLCRELPNIEWHSYYLKLDTILFLHGDVSNRLMTAADLAVYRRGWLHEEQKGELLNKLYDVAFRLGVHKTVNQLAFPTRKTLERLRYYLDDIGEGESSDTTHIFFGHTHVFVDGVEYAGRKVFNGGAPMDGLRFEVLSTNLPHDHSVRGQ